MSQKTEVNTFLPLPLFSRYKSTLLSLFPPKSIFFSLPLPHLPGNITENGGHGYWISQDLDFPSFKMVDFPVEHSDQQKQGCIIFASARHLCCRQDEESYTGMGHWDACGISGQWFRNISPVWTRLVLQAGGEHWFRLFSSLCCFPWQGNNMVHPSELQMCI